MASFAIVSFVATAADTQSVSPLLTTRWSQYSPYNNLCPEYAEGSHCATGCVATAMAQILKYHEYPVKGIGSHSYTWTYGDRKETLSADFGATTYRWDLMLDAYNASATAEEAEAVATLMYHCGVAANLEYTPATGGYADDAFSGVIDFLGYSPASVLIDRSDFDDAHWDAMLRDALDRGYPVLYGGFTEYYAGHAFVFDGYDSQGRFHVNWGYGDSHNRYYTFNSLNEFNYGHTAMILYPQRPTDGGERWVACCNGLSASVEDGNRLSGKVNISSTIKNYSGEAPTITFGLKLVDAAGVVSYVEGESRQLPDNGHLNHWMQVDGFSVEASAFDTEGHFTASAVYRLADDTSWHDVVVTREDNPSTFVVDVTAENVSVSQSGISDVKDDGVNIVADGHTMRIKNATDEVRVYDLSGVEIAGSKEPDASFSLPSGCYIVAVGDVKEKVVLK